MQRQQMVSDVPGETGRASMRARRAGARDAVPWARLRHDRGHHDAATLAQALHGQWRAAPRVAWAQAVALDDMSHQQRRPRALGAFCRRLHARCGPPTASTATAHTRARSAHLTGQELVHIERGGAL